MIAVQRVAVLGAGAWGTALALAADRAGRSVTLLARTPAQAEQLAGTRINPKLPEARLPATIGVESDLALCGRNDIIILAVPAQASAAALSGLRRLVPAGTPVIGAAKGIERTSGRFLSEIIVGELPEVSPAVLSGPGFASDVACGLPTALTMAAFDEALARALAQALASPEFRIYHTTDMRGVEIGGAAKNVLAIASGIATGRGLGASACAALTTRGFAELSRFARAYSACPETLAGLSGLGDLILTATSSKSRNFALGEALGRGVPLHVAMEGGLAEGASTAAALVRLAAARGVEMPIAAAVSAIVGGRLDVDTALRELLSRPLRSEAEPGGRSL